jgi:hypothetical protein
VVEESQMKVKNAHQELETVKSEHSKNSIVLFKEALIVVVTIMRKLERTLIVEKEKVS